MQNQAIQRHKDLSSLTWASTIWNQELFCSEQFHYCSGFGFCSGHTTWDRLWKATANCRDDHSEVAWLRWPITECLYCDQAGDWTRTCNLSPQAWVRWPPWVRLRCKSICFILMSVVVACESHIFWQSVSTIEQISFSWSILQFRSCCGTYSTNNWGDILTLRTRKSENTNECGRKQHLWRTFRNICVSDKVDKQTIPDIWSQIKLSNICFPIQYNAAEVSCRTKTCVCFDIEASVMKRPWWLREKET